MTRDWLLSKFNTTKNARVWWSRLDTSKPNSPANLVCEPIYATKSNTCWYYWHDTRTGDVINVIWQGGLLTWLECSEKTIFASIARIGFPAPPSSTRQKPCTLKSVAVAIVFLLRAKWVWRISQNSLSHLSNSGAQVSHGETSPHPKKLSPPHCRKFGNEEPQNQPTLNRG